MLIIITIIIAILVKQNEKKAYNIYRLYTE